MVRGEILEFVELQEKLESEFVGLVHSSLEAKSLLKLPFSAVRGVSWEGGFWPYSPHPRLSTCLFSVVCLSSWEN